MARNSCPTSVKNAGAQLVKARRMAADLVDQIQVAYAAVKATTASDINDHVVNFRVTVRSLI